jgi:hypothetical protein
MQGALKGDHIAVLSGGAFPYLLRCGGECYSMIGECYVYGLNLDGVMTDEDIDMQYLTLQ